MWLPLLRSWVFDSQARQFWMFSYSWVVSLGRRRKGSRFNVETLRNICTVWKCWTLRSWLFSRRYCFTPHSSWPGKRKHIFAYNAIRWVTISILILFWSIIYHCHFHMLSFLTEKLLFVTPKVDKRILSKIITMKPLGIQNLLIFFMTFLDYYFVHYFLPSFLHLFRAYH